MTAAFTPHRPTVRRAAVLVAALSTVGVGALVGGGLVVAPAAAATAPHGAESSTIRMVVGDAYTDDAGNTWASESGFRGGKTAFFTDDIVGTDRDELFQRERWNTDGYDIPVAAGTYRITLNMAELWFNAPGKRVFDVLAEDEVKDAGIDIFARAEAMYTPLRITFDTVVTDGVLSLTFVDRVNYAKVDSLKIRLVELLPGDPTPPPPPPSTYPRLASIDLNPGESWAEACVRTMTYGYTGCVRYFPPGFPTQWDATLQELASLAGDRRVDIQLTAKTHDHDGLASVLSQVPAAWKPTFIYNIFQEPEDNLTKPAQQAAYRADYTDAATVTREYGFQLPWIELQEWGVNPANPNDWNIAGFIPPAADYQGVLWSLFEFNQRDLLDGQVDNIVTAMGTYAPGKPWGLMAAEYAVPADAITDVTQRAQAAWLTRAYDLTTAAGSDGFAWFNMLYNNGKDLWEGRVEVNPYALAAMGEIS